MKKRVILVSHGKLAEGMAYSAQMICGEKSELSYYTMMPGEHYSSIVESIREQAELYADIQFIVIADLRGGSVCNGCTELVELENIKLVSGMNLGLVIELLMEDSCFTDDMILDCIEECKSGIGQVLPIVGKNENDAEDFF